MEIILFRDKTTQTVRLFSEWVTTVGLKINIYQREQEDILRGLTTYYAIFSPKVEYTDKPQNSRNLIGNGHTLSSTIRDLADKTSQQELRIVNHMCFKAPILI